MNKQVIPIAAMVAIALALAAGVILRDRANPPANSAEHAEHAEPAKQAPGDSHAGTIAFTDAQIAAAAIAVKTAGPVHIDTFIRMPGEVKFNEDRTAHLTARVDGIALQVAAQLGDKVRKGQLMASVASAAVAEQRSAVAASEQGLKYARALYATEKTLWEEKISARQDFMKAEQALREAEIALLNARQKLQALGVAGRGGPLNRLEIRAPFDGLIVEKHITPGESIGADTRVFTVSDLSTVWAEVVVPAKDLEIVRVGTPAILRSTASSAVAAGKVSFVSAVIGEQTRSARARVVLANPQLAWRPGLFVDVDIVTGAAAVAVAVEKQALQNVDGRQIVYRKTDGGFVAQPVSVGRTDGRMVEITGGLAAGQAYAAAGSFSIKAEQGKGEAGHED
ncbi:MAG: efflux transporter periplasmic adaptor subunit [Massilia sp.]|nr:efflux transporter periplasmic adaptor subunit [Massilia sp.]